jgi:asparagine synthase (glutamine-hydrolysing)
MSAICGIFKRKDSKDISVELSRLLSGLSHRGIDGSSFWSEKNVGFGIQYLWVTPESQKEKQPFYDSVLRLSIVADIRLDNRTQLLNDLGMAHQSLSDSEIVLRAYRAWGKDLAQKLRGEFAIAIWDIAQQQLILISDHTGLRSVYYYLNDEYFVFSSEIKALLKLNIVPCKPCLRKIAKMDFWVPDETPGETYFEKIYALPAATYWCITPHHVAPLQTYWQPRHEHRIFFKKEEEYIESFQSIFSEAIQGRLRSAYPVASTLSGGLDSSAVTAMAASLLAKENKSLRTYSVIKAAEHADHCVDEQEFIAHFNNTPNLHRTSVNDIWRGPFDDLEKLIQAGESPDFTSRHFYLASFVAKMKEQGERVLLTGRYGEAGPSSYGQGYYAELFVRGKIGRLIDEFRILHQQKGVSYFKLIKYHLIRPLIPFSLLAPRTDLLWKQLTSCIRIPFQQQQLGHRLRYYQKQSFEVARIRPNHHKNQVFSLNWMIQEQKARFKFVGYEHIEMSYPFLDPVLAEFCLAIPGAMKINQGMQRHLIRGGMRGIMPEAICDRMTKRPFSPDYHIRYNRQRHEILGFVNEMASEPLIQEIVDIPRLQQQLSVDMNHHQILTPGDFIAMITVPHTIYLLGFLKFFFLE